MCLVVQPLHKYCRYAFVRLQHLDKAHAAIAALHGKMVMGHMLQVKFADADAGPPLTMLSSGQTPSDSCYVKHLPPSYGVCQHQFVIPAAHGQLTLKHTVAPFP